MNYQKIYNNIIQNRLLNPITNEYTECHHILPKSLGGANRLENYQLSCENMNSKKGNILSEEDKKYGIKINKQ